MHSISLKIRITALALLVAVLPVSISQIINADRTTITLLDNYANYVENRSIQISNSINRFIQQELIEVLTISKAQILQIDDENRIKDYFNNIKGLNTIISDLVLVNKAGNVELSTTNDDEGHILWEVYLGVRELFVSSLNALENIQFVSEANHINGKPEIMVLTPLFHEDSTKAFAVLLVKLDLTEVENIITSYIDQSHPNLRTYVVDKLGNNIFKTIHSMPYTSKLKDVKLQPALLSNNSKGALRYINAEKVDVMTGFADMGEFGENKALDWSVISISPVEDVLYPATEARFILIVVGIVLTLLVTLIAYFFARGITLPLQRTAQLAQEICRGDYSHRLESNIGGEIGSLATAINEMADRIDERTAEIVNRNEKLTSEITERKLAEDRLKMLSHKIIRLQEEERQRVSRELHDGINQLLVSVKYKLENYVDRYKKTEGSQYNDITNAVLFLDEAISEVRRISHDLRPTVLDDLGLSAAIKNISRQFHDRNLIDVEIEGIDDEVLRRLPVDVETALYRIVQEALMNIEKHANATKVVINMTHTDINVTIRIEDDGEGFDLQRALRNPGSSQGIGLRNMRERIELLQGTFFMHSEEGKGTFIEVDAPLNLK